MDQPLSAREIQVFYFKVHVLKTHFFITRLESLYMMHHPGCDVPNMREYPEYGATSQI